MTATSVAPVASVVPFARARCSVTPCPSRARWQVGPKVEHRACDQHLPQVLRVVYRLLNAGAGEAS